jgi:hypothetical protein
MVTMTGMIEGPSEDAVADAEGTTEAELVDGAPPLQAATTRATATRAPIVGVRTARA